MSPVQFQSVLSECLEHTLYLAQKPAGASTLSAEEAEMAQLVGDTPLIVKYLALLARLLVVNTPRALGLLANQPPAQQRHSLELLLKCFLDFAPEMDKFQALLCGMGSCCLLPILLQGATSETSIAWLPGLLQIINKLRLEELQAPRSLQELLFKCPEKAETEVQRKSILEHKDPARTIAITQFLADKMHDLSHSAQIQVLSGARSNSNDLANALATLLQRRSATFHV